MFEAAELGRKLSKEEFQAIEPDLHTRLAYRMELELLALGKWWKSAGQQGLLGFPSHL